MGYVGRGLNQTGGQYRKLDDISSGFDGSETGFSLTVDNLEVTPTAQNLMISINGVIQDPGTAFTVSGGTITFTGAPAASSDFFGVVMGEASYIASGTVGASEMGVTAGAVTGSKGVVVDSSKNIQGINQVTATQYVGGGAGITGVTAEWDGTHTGNGVITGDLNITGNVTGSKVSASLGEFTSATIEGGTISGITDLAVADGGTGQSNLNDLITLTTHTTGNYVGTLTGGTGITSTGATTGEGIAHSISVDASQTQITGLSTVTTGVWDSTFGSTANTLISGSFGNQRVGTTDSPTFVNVTATGNITAQEFHTEFVSASIVYTSGSTKFGNSSDDIHQFTGSVHLTDSGSVSGSATSTGSFGGLYVGGGTHFPGGGISFGDGDTGLYESGDDTLRVKSGGNNIFYFNSTRMAGDATGAPSLLSAAGAAATPVYTFNDDVNTGMYRTGADAIGFSTGGTLRMTVSSSGNVGIGTASPASQMGASTVLEVKGSSIASLALQGAGSSRWELTSDNGDDFKVSRNGSTAITVDGSNNDATFGGDVKISQTDGTSKLTIHADNSPYQPSLVFMNGGANVVAGMEALGTTGEVKIGAYGANSGAYFPKIYSANAVALSFDTSQNATFAGGVNIAGTLDHTRGAYNQRASTYTISTDDLTSGTASSNGSDVTFEVPWSFPYQDTWIPIQINLQQDGNSATRYNAIVYCYSGYYSPYFTCAKIAEFNGSSGTIDGVTYAMTSGSSNYASRKLLVTVQMNSGYNWNQMEGTIGWHRGWR